MAQWNKNEQDYLNQERTLFEVFNVATKDGQQVSVDNPFPVSLGSSSITIIGDITIPGIVSVTSSPDNPIHNHIVEVGTGGTLTVPYLPVGISTLLNTVTIGNTVSISNTAFYILNPVTSVTVGGTVSIGNTVSISNTSFYVTGVGSTVNIQGTVSIGNTVSISNTSFYITGVGSTVNIQGTVGIGTTGQVSINVNNAPVSSSNPFPVTGTVAISTASVVPTTLPPTQTDAFARLRVSNPLTLFDSSHRYRDNNLWESLVVGTGSTVGFVTAQGLINISIGTTAGCSAIRETTKVFSYQPGKSLLVLNTFVMNAPKTNLKQRVGYFGTDNGMYLELDGDTLYFVERSLSTGTTTRVAQADWNIDTMLGAGHLNPSGITLDISKAQIMWMDIEWLGLGTVRMGFVINGQFIHCHSFHHANLIESTYITTASLPLRYEIANTGITTSVSTLKQVCSTVISEGGYELRGLQQAVGTPITTPYTLSVAGTFYPIISIRLKSSPNRLDAIVILTALSLMGVNNGISYNWQVRASGTTSGGTWTSAGDNSAVEYKLDGTAITGGRILASGFFNSANQGSPNVDILKEALFKFQLERNGLTGTSYELTVVVAASPISSTEKVYAAMDWEEISR
jgi:sorbitol-specific phosphotransferase system component IIA